MTHYIRCARPGRDNCFRATGISGVNDLKISAAGALGRFRRLEQNVVLYGRRSRIAISPHNRADRARSEAAGSWGFSRWAHYEGASALFLGLWRPVQQLPHRALIGLLETSGRRPEAAPANGDVAAAALLHTPAQDPRMQQQQDPREARKTGSFGPPSMAAT
jgi:hypothetical protein